MSERERANFLHAAVSRAPGKRQIKPSAAIFEGEAGAVDDDEDDEDFMASDVGSGHEAEDSDEGSSSSSYGSTNDADEDDDEAVEEDELDGGNSSIILDEKEPDDTTKKAESSICTICLNTKEYTRNAEVIHCDKCGLAVHEACYAVDDGSETLSNTSSASTEPWFCEPCLFNSSVVPHCELCPSRLGAFKKANVPGSWVHLLCALFTPGMTFGDTDHLTAISWQEMDVRAFGRKPCVACANRLEARTGVTVQCEAALCNNYYHITCAQKLGLLVDNETDDTHRPDETQQRHSSEFCYVLCKRHNHSDALSLKKDAYVKFHRQEMRRMAVFNRVVLTSRQDSKRLSQRDAFDVRMNRLENFVNIVPSIKRPRMLHNNSHFLNAFAEKAELFRGIDLERFVDEFLTPPADQIALVAPAFSNTFVKYFQNRETTVFPDEEDRLKLVKAEHDAALTQQKNLTAALKEVQERQPLAKTSNASAMTLLSRFCDALNALNVPKKNYAHASTPLLTPAKKAAQKSGATATQNYHQHQTQHPHRHSQAHHSTLIGSDAFPTKSKSKVSPKTASRIAQPPPSSSVTSVVKQRSPVAKKRAAARGIASHNEDANKSNAGTSRFSSSGAVKSPNSKLCDPNMSSPASIRLAITAVAELAGSSANFSSPSSSADASAAGGDSFKAAQSPNSFGKTKATGKAGGKHQTNHVGLPPVKRKKSTLANSTTAYKHDPETEGPSGSQHDSTSEFMPGNKTQSDWVTPNSGHANNNAGSKSTVREIQQQNLQQLLGTISNSPVKGAVSDADELSAAVISTLNKSPTPIKRPNILSRSSGNATVKMPQSVSSSESGLIAVVGPTEDLAGSAKFTSNIMKAGIEPTTSTSATHINNDNNRNNNIHSHFLDHRSVLTKLVAVRSPNFGKNATPFGGATTNGNAQSAGTVRGIGIAGRPRKSILIEKGFLSPKPS